MSAARRPGIPSTLRGLVLGAVCASASVTFVAATSAFAAEVSPHSNKPGAIILDRVPEAPDTSGRYLIYLHGRIIEEQGRRPSHPTFGIYEYDQILAALAAGGAVVISEQRPAQTNVDKFAAHVVDQVRTLVRAGVPPKNITVAGFSKGGGIAIRTSAFLKEPRVNFVFMGACGEGDFDRTDLKVEGRILSIYEANDEIGRSCKDLFAKGPGAGERSEIEVHVGDHHGTFFRVHREWIDPLLRWAETAPSPGLDPAPPPAPAGPRPAAGEPQR